MIVRPRPGAFTLVFSLRGSVLPQIAPRVLAIALVSALLTVIERTWSGSFPDLPAAPFTMLGLGLSIVLGFRNSACYDRWWEGRKLLGQLITESRSLTRRLQALLPDAALPPRVARRLLAFAHALVARLRDQPPSAAFDFLSAADIARLHGAPNPPGVILQLVSDDLAACLHRNEISAYSLHALEAHLANLATVQGACERIRATPMPFSYTLLLHRTAWLFCLLVPFALVQTAGYAAPLITAILAYAFFGLDALGDELEEPFSLQPNSLPLNALVRGLEIDLLAATGAQDLPAPLRPVDYLLQ